MASLVSTTVNGDLKVTGSSNLFFEGSASSNAFEPGTRIYGAGVTLTGGAYTSVFEYTVPGGLAGNFRFFVKGTTGNVVIPTQVDVLLNHSQDITIKSQSGNYTTLHVKVLTNNNEDCLVQIKADTAANANVTVYIDVIAFGDGSVSFSNFGSYTGTSLEHNCIFGFAFSSINGTTSTARFVLEGNSNGRLGVGTDVVNTDVEVSKSSTTNGPVIRLANRNDSISAGGTHGAIEFFSGDNSNPADQVVSSIKSIHVATSPNYGELAFSTGSNSEAVRINLSGNVGIGTTNPSQKLHVNGNITVNSQVIFSSGSNQYLEIGTNSIALKNSGGTVLWNSATALDSSTAWANMGAGTRTNYTLKFQPPSSSYAGFQFMGTNSANAGFLLVRGTSDSDVYTAEGITLVADQGWLTLAQRSASGKGVKIMTGSSPSRSRMTVSTNGDIVLGVPTNSLGTATTTTLKGYSAQYDAGGAGARLSNTGFLTWHTGTSWTSGERMWSLTNAYHIGAGGTGPKFALLRGDNNTTVPTLGNAGSLGTDTSLSCYWTKDGVFHNTGPVSIVTQTLPSSNRFHVSSGSSGSASKSSIAVVSVADSSTFNNGTAALHVINSGNRGTKGNSIGSDLLRLEFSDGIHTIFNKDGSVGIGTTSPARTLDLTTTGQITFGNNVVHNGSQGIYWHSSNTYGIYRTGEGWNSPDYAQLQIRFETGIILHPGSGAHGRSHVGVVGGVSIGDSYFSTKKDNGLIVQGSVGIGTNAPESLLHLQGSIPTIILHDTNTAVSGDDYGKIQWHTRDASMPGTDDIGAEIKATDDSTYGDRAALLFSTAHNATSLTERMRIASNGQAGFGSGTFGSNNVLTITNVGNGAAYSAIALGTATTGHGNSEGYWIGMLENGQAYLWNYENQAILFGSNNTERMRINADGNVGIGTTQPSQKLDVRGDILIKGPSTSSSTHSVLRFQRGNATNDFATIGFENPALANDEFLISAAGNGNPIKLQSGANTSMNFYIGTTHMLALTTGALYPPSNGTKDLGLSGNRWNNVYSEAGNFSGNLTLAGDSASRFYFGNKLAIEGQISNNNLDLGENFANIRMRSSSDVFPTNSVNLGTSSSRWDTIYGAAGNFSGNLTVSGTLTNGGFYSAGTGFVSLTSNNPSIRFYESDTTNTNWDVQVNSGTLKFLTVYDNNTNFSEKLTITNAGTVAISGTLDVNGSGQQMASFGNTSARCGIEVKSSQWCEVFFTNSTYANSARIGMAYDSSHSSSTENGDWYVYQPNVARMDIIVRRTGNVILCGAGGASAGKVGIGTTNPSASLHVGNSTTATEPLRLQKSDDNVSNHVTFYSATTRVGEIGCQDTSWLRINQVTNKNIYTPRLIRADGGFQVDGNDVITGGGIHTGSGAQLTSLNGSNIGSGTVPAARLGSGSSITSKFLRGDNTWQTVTSGGGTITGVTVGTGLDGGGTSGSVSINLDLNELTSTNAPIGTDKMVFVDGSANASYQISTVPLSIFNNDAGWTSNTGDITNVSVGTGLDGGGASGSVTINLDLSELTSTNAPIGTDKMVFVDGSANASYQISTIPLSIFNNDAGWTSNAGDITGVTAGTGLSGGGTSGSVTVNLANTTVTAGSYTNTNITVDAQGRITAASNGSGGGGSGDITAVTAGNGLTGGGTSGAVTLNVAGGTGINVAADSISVAGGVCMSIYTSYNTTSSSANSNSFTFASGGSLVVTGDGYSTITFSDSSSSDYRIKKNISTFNSEAWTKVKSVNVRKFDFNDLAKDAEPGLEGRTDVIGFIAHELAEAGIEGAVEGEKDAVDGEGNAVYQKICQVKLIPVMWGALNEALNRIETLETKVRSLEDSS